MLNGRNERVVAVVPSHAELTTQHITFEALMEFKRRDDLKPRAAAGDLADLSQELGRY